VASALHPVGRIKIDTLNGEMDKQLVYTTLTDTNGRCYCEHWLTDGYIRHYETAKEFSKHSGRDPVDVGLMRRCGRWYRLPFSAGFFVLGESHSIFGYRELLTESNRHQLGNPRVLGEGGSIPIGEKKGDYLRKSSAEGSLEIEYMMEAELPKAFAYAQALLQETRSFLSQKKTSSSTTNQPGEREEPEDEWIKRYRLATSRGVAVDRKDKRFGVPYYLGGDGARVYAQYGATKADKYLDSLTQKAVDWVRHFTDGVMSLDANTLPRSLKTTPGQKLLKALRLLKESGHLKVENCRSSSGATELGWLKVLLEDVVSAWESFIRSKAASFFTKSKNTTDPTKSTLLKVVAGAGAGELASRMREVYMVRAIAAAASSPQKYQIAGIGDNHAKQLVELQQKENVLPGTTIITLDDLLNKYSESALI
jgi:hypothetical protein